MSFNKGPKAGALVPESDSTLSSILEKLGVLVKKYRYLDDFKSIREAVQGLGEEELVFLFCNIEKAYEPEFPNRGRVDIANLIKGANEEGWAGESLYNMGLDSLGAVELVETMRSPPTETPPMGVPLNEANEELLVKSGVKVKLTGIIQDLVRAMGKGRSKKTGASENSSSTEAIKNENADGSEGPMGIRDESLVKMSLALALKERIQEMASEGVRRRVEAVMILPRESELLKDFPKEARFLSDDFTENELHFLLERWAEETTRATDEVRAEIRRLAPEELGILIAHEDPHVRSALKQWLLLLLKIAPENIVEVDNDMGALEKISDDQGNIKILLTGTKSPKLDSLELLRLLKDNRREIRRILILPNINSWEEAENAHHRLVHPLNIQKLRGILIDCLPALNVEVGIFKNFDEEAATLPAEGIATASGIKIAPPSRITPLPLSPKWISTSASNGSSHRMNLEMGRGVDSLDIGRSLNYELPPAELLLAAVVKEEEDHLGQLKSGEHFPLLETILLTAEEKQNVILEKEGGISYPPEEGQGSEGSENVQVLGKKLDERRFTLRLLDREKAVQILARFSVPLNLSKHSQPKENYDSRAIKRFENNEQVNELLNANDWIISRNLEESAKVLGIENLIELQRLAIETAHPKKYRQPIVVHLGPGDGKIMDEFESAYTDRPVRHVAIGRSILFNLSDLLDRSLNKDLPEGEASDLKRFNVRITHLLQRHFGRFGRLEIRLNLPGDQARLRDYLLRLAGKEEVLGYAAGKRKTATTTGKYADDKWERLKDGEVRLFAEYAKDPVAFFSKYYGGFFDTESPQDMNEILGLKSRDMIFGDFRDMPELLKDCDNFITFAYSVKGFSHLEDFDYGVAFNEVAARLHPGGILIDDGVVESHTWAQRIHELREVYRNLGANGQYRIYLIGNEKGPMSVVCQRGVPKEKGGYHFTIPEGLRVLKEKKRPLTIINVGGRKNKTYEQLWSKAALRNKLTHHIKNRIVEALVYGIVDKRLRLECTQTWRQACLKEIDPLFNDIFDKMVALWEGQNKSQAGNLEKRDRIKLSNNKNVADLLELFEKKTGESLDSFIEKLLLRLYPLKNETNGPT